MKLLNLTAALFLGGVLQAQNPLPAIQPQPQEVTLSTNRMKAPHGFTLSGMQHPDEDAMRLIRQTLSITDNSEALPLKITSLEDRTPELKRSGAYLLVITPEEIDIAISDSRGLFYAAQTLQQLAQTDKAIRHCHSELSKTILTSPTVEPSKVFTAIPGAIPTASSSFVFMER